MVNAQSFYNSGVTLIKAEGHSALPGFFQNGNAIPEI